MTATARVATMLLLSTLAACASETTAVVPDGASLRLVNAFSVPVEVSVDGAVTIASLAAGSMGTTPTSGGTHTLLLRPAGSGTPFTGSITTAASALSTIAVVRSAAGTVATAILDDTGSVVPAGATKLRVLHLAPNAGTLQVYRTQPDYGTPVSWQFPFTYQAQPTALSAPFYQSTVGSWEVRAWQSPVGASGWTTAPVRIVVPLNSGEKHTILLLDAAGGGVRAEII